MFSYLFFTDLHLGVHANSSIWLDASIELAKEIVDKCIEKNINKVIFLGDFFHERRSINTKTLNYGLNFCDVFESKKIDLFLVVGNHDTYLKNSLHPHSLSIFKKFNHIHVIDDIEKLDDLLTLIPWNFSWKNIKTPYIAGHFEISGCELNDDFTSFGSQHEIKEFKNFKQVFSGHFHTPNIKENINYIGSVMPFTFHDVNSKRGYYIFNLSEDLFTFEFFEFKSCPEYKLIYSNQSFTEDEIKGNVVKLVYVEELSTISNEKLLEQINLYKPVMLLTDFRKLDVSNSEDFERTEDNKFLKSNKELMFEYIDKIETPDHINDKTLKEMIKNLLVSKSDLNGVSE